MPPPIRRCATCVHTGAMRIALTLGSGGARGFAHMGVIEELEARGHDIVAVSGSSMGALVGGVYAAGKLPEFQDWAYALTQSSVFGLLDFVLRGPGIVNADRVVGDIAEILGNVQIENLSIPYTAVATDLTARREVWFQTGPLAMAIRASIAIPSVITPVNYEGHILADGGIMNPIPLEPLSSVVADATVAVALSGKPIVVETVAAPTDKVEEAHLPGWLSKFMTLGSDLLDKQPANGLAAHLPHHDKGESGGLAAGETDHGPSFDPLPESLKVADVITMSLDTMEGAIGRYRMAANPPDVLVSVPRDAANTYDFHRAREIADLGREKAIAAFDDARL